MSNYSNYSKQNPKFWDLGHWSFFRLIRSIRIIRLIVFFFALSILISQYLDSALAQSPATRSFTISPPSLTFTLKPGQKTEKIIKITNNSASAITMTVDVHDFIVTDKKGTPEIIPADAKINNMYAASTWMTALPDTITIPAGKTMTTTLYLQVPGNARPGGRYVSVAFKPLGGENPEGSGAAVNTIVGSLIYLTVAGPVKEDARVTMFDIPKFSEYGPIAINTEIKNNSDIHISPRATVEIKDMLGQTAYKASLGDYNVFPGTSRLYTNSWEQKWLFGRFTANLAGYYGSKNLPLIAVATFWVIPYKMIVGVLLAIAIITVLYLYLKKRQESGKEVEEEK